MTQNPQLDVLSINLRPVGALQVGQHEAIVVFLDFDMKAADPFVVELDGIAFLAADCHRSGQTIKYSPAIGAIEHALFTEGLEGPVNLTAPEPCTAAAVAKTLGRVLGRPSFARVPAFALKAMFGESAEAAMLASQRVKPAALEASGFTFLHPTLEQCLRFTLGR